jgi:signal recognition particle receptor subunit beta
MIKDFNEITSIHPRLEIREIVTKRTEESESDVFVPLTKQEVKEAVAPEPVVEEQDATEIHVEEVEAAENNFKEKADQLIE